MIQKIRKITGLGRDKSGSTLVEFGFVAGPLVLMIMGLFDLGYQSYVNVMSKSILHRVARVASSGTLNQLGIELYVKNHIDAVILDDAVVTVTAKSYFDFTNLGKPEKIVVDNNTNSVLDVGDCFIDANSNGTFDTDVGKSGTGGPDDIVRYEITIDSPRLFPMAKLIGVSERVVNVNSTAVRNQPFGAKNAATETQVCRTV